MSIDVAHVVARNQRLVARLTGVTQPVRPEVGGWMQSFFWGVVREIPADDAPYVGCQFVRPAADYAETGHAEFIPDSFRPVLCELNLTAADYQQWLWEGSEDLWVPAIVAHLVFPAYGALWIQQKGRFEYVQDMGGLAPTDCYLFGGT